MTEQQKYRTKTDMTVLPLSNVPVTWYFAPVPREECRRYVYLKDNALCGFPKKARIFFKSKVDAKEHAKLAGYKIVTREEWKEWKLARKSRSNSSERDTTKASA